MIPVYYDESGNGNEFSYGKLGGATIETQPDTDNFATWYYDRAGFLYSDNSWCGGYYYDGTYAGMFRFSCDNGNASGVGGSRVVLSVAVS